MYFGCEREARALPTQTVVTMDGSFDFEIVL